jgi:hypothetical protein
MLLHPFVLWLGTFNLRPGVVVVINVHKINETYNLRPGGGWSLHGGGFMTREGVVMGLWTAEEDIVI